MGRQYQGMDRPGVRQVPEGIGEQGKMEKTGCKIICGAPAPFAVMGLMMVMMTDMQLITCLPAYWCHIYIIYIFSLNALATCLRLLFQI